MTAEPKSDQPGKPPDKPIGRQSSRQRYLEFVRDYKLRKLDSEKKDDEAQEADGAPEAETEKRPPDPRRRRAKRREFLYEYTRWLWPHRYSVAAVFVFALMAAGLEMAEPLFMRFIIDRVLLNI